MRRHLRGGLQPATGLLQRGGVGASPEAEMSCLAALKGYRRVQEGYFAAFPLFTRV